jgi:hypothetical protein
MGRRHIRISTTQQQRNLAKELADERNTPKIKRGMKNTAWRPNTDDLTPHLEGCLGEVVTSDYIGAELNRNISLGGSDWDIRLPCGCLGEVKTRGRQGFDFALAGASLDYLVKYYESRDYGHGARFVLKSKWFKSIDDLKDGRLVHGPSCARFIKPDGVQIGLFAS